MKNYFKLSILFFLFINCSQKSDIEQYGLKYQQHQDYKNLKKVVDLLPQNADTTFVKEILGIPNNMGFEFRYTTDSIGTNGCTIGAVFQYNKKGKITNKWINEICE